MALRVAGGESAIPAEWSWAGRWSGVPAIAGSKLNDPATTVHDLGRFGLLYAVSGEVGQLECWEKNLPLPSREGLGCIELGGEGFSGEVLGEELERG